MKKLKVILPAILTLAVSTSAAVTGTVAWFTATRLRTVKAENIAVVDPEEGLNLVSVTADAGCTLENVTDGEPDAGQTPIVHHAQYTVESTDVQGYFRDGSVLLPTGTVYKAELDDEGLTGNYLTVASPYNDPNKKYTDGEGDKNVYHATKFTLKFSVDHADSTVYNPSLFLDLDNSKATLTSAGGSAKDIKLYNSLRFGFVGANNEWFVWAPFSTLEAAAATHVTGADETDHYETANWTKGNATATDAVNETIKETNGVVAKNIGINYVGYLGILNTTGIDVSVYTWFEGCDPDCDSENFEHLVAGVAADFKFVSRNVLAA